MKEKILFVDDDLNVLTGYSRIMRHKFMVETAESGSEGVSLLKESGPFVVVVSDFRMPGMDGIQFLSKARQISPNTVRVMLTGQADLQVSIDAVNEGNLFRFLTKPCPSDLLINTLTDAAKQYELITAERVLLEKTLKGSVKTLIDILSIVSPVVFSQSSRLRNIARILAVRLNVENLWEVELATLLSQIGCVTIPGDILERRNQGKSISEKENEMFLSHPIAGRKLLANIPRLERIAEAIAYQMKQFDGGGIPDDGKKGVDIPLTGRILKAIFDFDAIQATGKTAVQSIGIMRSHKEWYDPDIFAALEDEFISRKWQKNISNRQEREKMIFSEAELVDKNDKNKNLFIKEIGLKSIWPGMVLAEDIKDKSGAILLAKGQEITEVVKMRLFNYGRAETIVEPIRVWMPNIK